MDREHREFLIFSDTLPETCRKALPVASACNFGPESEKSRVIGLSSAARYEEDLARGGPPRRRSCGVTLRLRDVTMRPCTAAPKVQTTCSDNHWINGEPVTGSHR